MQGEKKPEPTIRTVLEELMAYRRETLREIEKLSQGINLLLGRSKSDHNGIRDEVRWLRESLEKKDRVYVAGVEDRIHRHELRIQELERFFQKE